MLSTTTNIIAVRLSLVIEKQISLTPNSAHEYKGKYDELLSNTTKEKFTQDKRRAAKKKSEETFSDPDVPSFLENNILAKKLESVKNNINKIIQQILVPRSLGLVGPMPNLLPSNLNYYIKFLPVP